MDEEGAIFCCEEYDLDSREGGEVANDGSELEGVKLPPKGDW